MSSSDELAEIDGLKPNVVLVEGEETEVKSKSSKGVYKVKRTFDHYYCTCPAWRNQSGAPTNARTCKHLQGLLGEEYEAARIKLKNPDGVAAKKPASKKAAASKPQSQAKGRATKRKKDDEDNEDEKDEEKAVPKKKPASKKAASKPQNKGKGRATKSRKEDEDEDENEDEEAQENEDPPKKKPSSKVSKPASKAHSDSKPQSTIKGKGKRKRDDDDDGEEEDKNDDQNNDKEDTGRMDTAPDGDELAEIDGIKPKVYLADGDEKEVRSQTSDSTYKVKRTWDHYYCTCPAWRNQGGAPTNARTCKHLSALLGDKYEAARIKLKNPDGPQPKIKGKPASKRAAKKAKKDNDDDDDDEEEEEGKTGKPSLLLANKWDLEKGTDPTGWWISEKLDGVRTFYDGKRMISRLGNPFTPPQWFLDKLPKDVTLDGELFGGRGKFQSTVSIVKTVNSPHWKGITFHVFDIPSRGSEPFEKRIEYLKELFSENGTHASDIVVVVDQEEAKNRDHVLEKLKEVESLGGEGLMLRKPGSEYQGSRSSTLLKIKTFFDAEAIVLGYEGGKGKNAGVTGALKCKMESGKTFSVGSGLSDKQRKNPPKVGSIITYRFQELTNSGVPRFPTFIGEAIDKDEPKDAEIPEHRKGTTKSSDD